jgi:hypothetical protein
MAKIGASSVVTFPWSQSKSPGMKKQQSVRQSSSELEKMFEWRKGTQFAEASHLVAVVQFSRFSEWPAVRILGVCTLPFFNCLTTTFNRLTDSPLPNQKRCLSE